MLPISRNLRSLPRSVAATRAALHPSQRWSPRVWAATAAPASMRCVQSTAKAKLEAQPAADLGPKDAGTIASVFATLSGGTLEDALPDRFADLKKKILASHPDMESHLLRSWASVLPALSSELDAIVQKQQSAFPTVAYPGDQVAAKGLHAWMDKDTLAEVKKRGVVVVKGVVPKEQALQWKDDVLKYARKNNARGFPEDDPQVFELYWSKAQVGARASPALLQTSRSFLELWHQDRTGATGDAGDLSVEQLADMSTPLTYADRLRVRMPGDAQFALGPHIDGGGVERWEDPSFMDVWHDVLSPQGRGWQHFDNWSLGPNGERMTAKGDMYNGPGQCSVFRPLQGWLSMSDTGPNEGTLKVLPNLREATAYIVLRPFFQPLQPPTAFASPEGFLAPENWAFDGESRKFPGCSLGHNIELSPATHPHLRLDETMISLRHVEPGDAVFWHCDAVHAVESVHAGIGDSSVMYIPAIPLTATNWRYVLKQADAFKAGIPPQDFPGGEGESRFTGRMTPEEITHVPARQAMGLDAPEASHAGGLDRNVGRIRAWATAQQQQQRRGFSSSARHRAASAIAQGEARYDDGSSTGQSAPPPNSIASSRLWKITPWLPVAAFLYGNFCSVGTVSGGSMTPTLNPEYNTLGVSAQRDLVMLDRFVAVGNRCNVGDVVVLISPSNPNVLLTKRLLALPGDIVRYQKKTRVPVTGADGRPAFKEVLVWTRLEVPEGHCWVEGDSAVFASGAGAGQSQTRTQTQGYTDLSRDSRHFGPVPLSLLTARVSHVLWPLSRAGPVGPRPRPDGTAPVQQQQREGRQAPAPAGDAAALADESESGPLLIIGSDESDAGALTVSTGALSPQPQPKGRRNRIAESSGLGPGLPSTGEIPAARRSSAHLSTSGSASATLATGEDTETLPVTRALFARDAGQGPDARERARRTRSRIEELDEDERERLRRYWNASSAGGRLGDAAGV